MGISKKKIDAIYELRHAAEEKARAEARVDDDPTPQNRDDLLEKRATLEDRTMDAITVCHDCGHEHDPSSPHVH